MKFFYRSRLEFLTRKHLPVGYVRPTALSYMLSLSNLFVVSALMLNACSSAAPPLVIKMYHPETKQSLTCAAKDELTQANSSALASAVETCARHLETQGFVRER
jgi:hypothetical protein